MMKRLDWIVRIVAAGILVQTLFFKFRGAEESVFIFSQLGVEPWGRIGSGVVELAASILLLIPRTAWIGSLTALGVMAGGDSALLIFVGHNGLMDFRIDSSPQANPSAQPRSSVVLACASQGYFRPHLIRGGSSPLLLTTGLMAPEAYTVRAIVESFAAGGDPPSIRQAAAEAYNAYQKCGRRAALNLFAPGF